MKSGGKRGKQIDTSCDQCMKADQTTLESALPMVLTVGRSQHVQCRAIPQRTGVRCRPTHELLCKKTFNLQEPPLMTMKKEFMAVAGTTNQCRRCQATSKRTKLQCGSVAMRGKQKCRIHGGLSTGPKTDAGKQRCAEAKFIHGRESRAIRAERAVKLRELKGLAKIIATW